MSDDMQAEAIEVAHEALEKYTVEKVCTRLTQLILHTHENYRTLHSTSRKRFAITPLQLVASMLISHIVRQQERRNLALYCWEEFRKFRHS